MLLNLLSSGEPGEHSSRACPSQKHHLPAALCKHSSIPQRYAVLVPDHHNTVSIAIKHVVIYLLVESHAFKLWKMQNPWGTIKWGMPVYFGGTSPPNTLKFQGTWNLEVHHPNFLFLGTCSNTIHTASHWSQWISSSLFIYKGWSFLLPLKLETHSLKPCGIYCSTCVLH